MINMSGCEIPTINIEPWLDGSAPDAVVAEIRHACKMYGFFQLVGHGVPLTLQRRVFESAKKFFSLPPEQKQALAKDPSSGRGYERIHSQALQPGQSPDLKEVKLNPIKETRILTRRTLIRSEKQT